MKQNSLIFLTGFSGSGKSTIGPLLANSLGFEFIDLDLAIEQSAGKPITRIFAEEGEPAFRLLELSALRQLAGNSDMVVSLGGGVLEHDECFRFIRENGTLIYLKSNPKALSKRLCNKTDRPLLLGRNGMRLSREEIENKITAILKKRETRYAIADITVQTDTKRIGSTVEELTRKINRFIRQTEQCHHNNQSVNNADQ
ncbi:MAG: shikimate kinase [Chlorobium sp.]|jgi:shikimate kinase|uniref:shikimate kinase n=1 Tax=Chlorobium sp. TaxID=1095 RepID=UPI001D7281E8|nr:shikimate kinase [Chlorobium sp.]MBN1278394.1 shikimate kinase [Chlorobiaceae bacterium]MCF8217132.1 shikimate kinase [Chlorobium sp.]MCF8271975.1 shikimate kinase [Chlorobium sp.]MCF8288350.1 shikimate kinase [Chlorobium sp.]MCF8291941.1 shikimate kinase [Chlorobium sp.]